jgi:hypothetical protein
MADPVSTNREDWLNVALRVLIDEGARRSGNDTGAAAGMFPVEFLLVLQ